MPKHEYPTETAAELAISDAEFSRRVTAAQALIDDAEFDAMLVNSNEADFANVRYFSDFWTLFEQAGVLIPADGKPALLVGPESGEYARDRSKIAHVFKMLEYRESADPAYPGVAVSTFDDVFRAVGLRVPKRIGIAGWLVTPAPLMQSLQKALPNTQFVPCDSIMVKLRSIKSPTEIACLKRAFQISEAAVESVLARLTPGLTEQQVVGIAQQALYEHGAEYEGHPTYVLSGRNSTHAISRPTSRELRSGDLIQLNIGARYKGYSSSVGLPVCMGKMPSEMREAVQFGLDAHQMTIDAMKAGVRAGTIARAYREFFAEHGFGKNFLYGPCHGLGMLEVEQPWMEETSDYCLQPNMTFQVDTFLTGPEFGLRWENGGRITDTGLELFSGKFRRVHEIG